MLDAQRRGRFEARHDVDSERGGYGHDYDWGYSSDDVEEEANWEPTATTWRHGSHGGILAIDGADLKRPSTWPSYQRARAHGSRRQEYEASPVREQRRRRWRDEQGRSRAEPVGWVREIAYWCLLCCACVLLVRVRRPPRPSRE